MSEIKACPWCGEPRAGKSGATVFCTNCRRSVEAVPTIGDDPVAAWNDLATMREERDRAIWLLVQIVTALPKSRDWLDPNVEEEARAIARKALGVDR